jgi:hypothetical protein
VGCFSPSWAKEKSLKISWTPSMVKHLYGTGTPRNIDDATYEKWNRVLIGKLIPEVLKPEKKSNWLEELKHNSWEPETIISGIAILGLFQVPRLLDRFLIFFNANVYGETTDMDNAVSLLKVAIYWVILGLVIHLVIRAIWVGMIGLSYSFPGGVFLCVFVICSFFWFANILNSTYPGDSISRIKLWNNSSGYSVFNGYYDDQNKEKYSIRAQIQSDIITGNTVRLFVAANVEQEKDIREYSGMDSLLQKNPGFDPDSLALEAFGSFYHVFLADSLLTDLVWKFHYKEHTRQKGYLSYIDISELPTGLYNLKLNSPRGRGFANIIFYREEVHTQK